MSSTPVRKPSREQLAVHTITTKPLTIEEACDQYAARGIAGISIWIEAIEGRKAVDVRRLTDAAGLRVPALVRGGFFCDQSMEIRRQKVEHNRRLIATAAELGAEMIVLVVGAAPGSSLEVQRGWVQASIEQLVPDAEQQGVKLAVEPLHPMYAGDRSCVNTLAQARRLCERIAHPAVGVALDVYHTWWDETLEQEIRELSRQKALFAFHLCDWRCPTRDMLNDRALMGDGCIDLSTIRNWVYENGYDGWEEVEIFSNEHWLSDQGKFLDQIVDRYSKL